MCMFPLKKLARKGLMPCLVWNFVGYQFLCGFEPGPIESKTPYTIHTIG